MADAPRSTRLLRRSRTDRVIAGEAVLTRLADHLGLHDIEFESDDFNLRFNVKCADRTSRTTWSIPG